MPAAGITVVGFFVPIYRTWGSILFIAAGVCVFYVIDRLGKGNWLRWLDWVYFRAFIALLLCVVGLIAREWGLAFAGAAIAAFAFWFAPPKRS